MELTKTFQKIADGETKQFGGSTGKLELWAKYNSQDIANNRSNVTVELRLVCSSYIGNYQATYWSISGSLANSGNLGSGDYYSRTLGSATGNVLHEVDGTKTVTFSGNFNPTAWGMSISVSGSATLPSLHKPPTIQTAEMVETDATMISLGVPNTTIVQYLSKKTITLHGTAEDDATLTYRLEHFGTNYNIPTTGYQASNVFNTDYTQNNITISTDNKANIVQKLKDSMNGETTDWVYVNINGVAQKPNGIAYAKPTIERTSTSIKRKSGGGVNLTDNKVSLNLKATFYKGNDVIGNNNSIIQIGYKIWATNDTEPANYTTLTPTISGGNITITDFEISNIVFTNTYNYKIIITDNYGYSDVITDGRIPIGVSLWTEYKDRVDFLKLTVGGYNPFEYSTSETICGVWNDGYNEKPIYRKTFELDLTQNHLDNTNEAHNISNIDMIFREYGWLVRNTTDGSGVPIPTYESSTYYVIIKGNKQYLTYKNSNFNGTAYITLEYTKN